MKLLDQVIWKDPPAPAGPRDKLIKQLQAKPGQWGMVQTGEKNASAVTTWKKLGCEAKSVKEDGGYAIYARWPAAKAGTITAAVAEEIGRKKPQYLPPPPSGDKGLDRMMAERAARGVPPEGLRVDDDE